MEVAAIYRAAGEGTEVGGDFYDVFERAEGDWAVVMGDVCGKGADAAALTGLSRHTIRAAAMQERDPSVVLETLNDAILLQDTGRFCTVCYARLEPLGSRTTGHVGSDERFQAGMLGQLEHVHRELEVDQPPGAQLYVERPARRLMALDLGAHLRCIGGDHGIVARQA